MAGKGRGMCLVLLVACCRGLYCWSEPCCWSPGETRTSWCCQQHGLFKKLSSILCSNDWNLPFWWTRGRLSSVFSPVLSWSGGVWYEAPRKPFLCWCLYTRTGNRIFRSVRLKRELNLDLLHPKLKCCMLENWVKKPYQCCWHRPFYLFCLISEDSVLDMCLEKSRFVIETLIPSQWVLSSSEPVLKANLDSALSWQFVFVKPGLTPQISYSV